MLRIQSVTVTLTGTPAFTTAYAYATTTAVIIANGCTFTGGATGKYYDARLNAVINTVGGGATYFPGDAAGSTATGAQYA